MGKSSLNENHVRVTMEKDAAASFFGALCLSAAGVPFDAVKSVLQVGHKQGTPNGGGLLRAIGTVWRSGRGNPLVFWRGFSPACASACVENVTLFTVNGSLNRSVQTMTGQSVLTLPQEFVVGAASGVFSATAICVPGGWYRGEGGGEGRR